MKKRITVLGATGSIGRNTVQVVRANPDDFQIVGLASFRDLEGLRSLSSEFPNARLALSGYENPPEGIDFAGPNAAVKLVQQIDSDLVVNGINGAAGFMPSLASLQSGADLALANKESIVIAWEIISSEADKNNCKILPVDSEHSAIFHLVSAHGILDVDEIILTASGGPFRTWSSQEIASVTLKEALTHPTWNMGGKITVDSASLANKGLEVIEAVKLFGIHPDKVKVLIHPQSRVHSLIRLRDGSLYAQISQPDMRIPIHNALFWPECRKNPFGFLDLADSILSFEKPKEDLFPMLKLAYKAAELGALYPNAYNAANEIAVSAFMNGSLGFTDIPLITAAVLDKDWTGKIDTVEAVLDGDGRARREATRIITEVIV